MNTSPSSSAPSSSSNLPEPDGVKVRVHPGLCAAWGNCHRWAPDVYPLDEEGFIDIHLLDVPAEHAAQAWIGASVCPERAISVIGKSEEYWLEFDRQRKAETATHLSDGSSQDSTSDGNEQR